MKRRDFLAVAAAGVAAEALVGCTSTRVGPKRVGADLTGDELYRHLVAQNDAGIPSLLSRVKGGGLPDRYGLYHPGSSAGLFRTLSAVYAAPESRYAREEKLLAPMRAAVARLLEFQHDDGTVDLITTNFHSPPDTAFVLEHVCTAARVLHGLRSPVLEELLADTRRFIERGAGALAVGGIHTPNHRWVVCASLARAHVLYPDARYVERIDEWLAEGIDLDADGQFTERSTSIYSPLTDRCLATIARLVDRPTLYEPVRRNLEMTIYYVHADGEVVTEGSRRQDQFRRGSLAPYHYAYRAMALRDYNARFAAMARWIERTSLPRLNGNLIYMLEDPGLRAEMLASAVLPERYEKHFAASGLVRIRDGARSATILADNATFFSLHQGRAAVAVRLASAFFGKGQFVGEGLRRVDGAWVLEQTLRGPYYQPLAAEKRRADGDWSKMSRADRAQTEVQTLRSKVTVRQEQGSFRLAIEITGCDHVPVAIELGFRKGGALEGVQEISHAVDSFVLASGYGRYRYGDDAIEFGPGAAPHQWSQLRGALPKLPADSVYITGVTPFRTELTLR